MSDFIELSDAATAETAASLLMALGEQLNDGASPPSVNWGDDSFGEAMLEAYNQPGEDGQPVHVSCLAEKATLGNDLSQVGENVSKAVGELTGQEADNQSRFDRLVPPGV